MATGISNYGDINQRTAAWASKEMLAHAEPIIVLGKFGLVKPIPKNIANGVKFRRPIPFVVTTTPLTEGVTPAAQQMQYEDVAVTLYQYGATAELTDVVEDLAEDPVLKDMAMLSGEQAAETMEMVTFGALIAGTNVFYDTSTTVSRATVATPVSKNRLRAVIKSIKSHRGKEINSMLDSSPKFDTHPVEGGYICFCSSDLDGDIRDLPNFVSTAKYGSREPLCPQELGSVENLRFITSPLLSPFLGAGAAVASAPGMMSSGGVHADVYPMIIVAKDAYGSVPLKGADAITPMVLNPGTPDKSDPLGQRGYVSWKAYFNAAILNQTWMARLEVCATAD